MKPLLLRLVLTLPVAGLLLVSPTSRAADPNTSVTLQVQVSLPASHQPHPDPAFVSAFVSRIREAFAAQGYVGAIAEASGRELPNETAVLLNLGVTELRVRDDEIDCAFTATVRTAAEELEVGRFHDKGLRWNRSAGKLGPRRESADNDATMLRLYQAVAASGLVPGLTIGR